MILGYSQGQLIVDKKKNSNKRQVIPNFEILHILAMFMIVAAHANQWGYFFRGQIEFSMDNAVNSALYPLLCVFNGNFGVNCFVLISSWFFCDNQKFKYDKILKCWIQVVFYSFIIAAVFACFGKISFKETLPYLTPIYHNTYWFMTKYVGFLLLAPFLSMLFNTFDKEIFHAYFLAMLLLCVTIVRNIPYGNIFISETQPSSLILWSFLFGIAAYLKRYGLPEKIAENRGKLFLLLVLIQWLGGILINVLEETPSIAACFSGASNGLTLFTSVLFFSWIKDLQFRDCTTVRFLTFLAPFSFGVYMIHEHPLIREFIWGKVFNMTKAFNSPYYILYLLATCLAIYSCSSLIDWARTRIFKLFTAKK